MYTFLTYHMIACSPCYYVNVNIYLESHLLLFFLATILLTTAMAGSILSPPSSRFLLTTHGFACVQSSRCGHRETDSILGGSRKDGKFPKEAFLQSSARS